jgi:FtsP/CotA-like multicopper oxidase with cupredoxin domain
MMKLKIIVPKIIFVFITVIMSTVAMSTAGYAVAKPGCEFAPIDINKYGGGVFKNPEILRSSKGELNVTLDLKYATRTIAGCETNLRSYNGKPVGPTLIVKPGDTLNVDLSNLLPPDTTPPSSNINIPHDFNVTNFHTHGLHVSPTGNSDNVLLKIKPGQKFHFEINVPKDHPPGTFWYHAHIHGSTALQVGSGVSGVIIIKGGLDRVDQIKVAKQKVFVFQQISYDEQGEIEDYSVFGPGRWEQLQRQTTINGQIVPVIYMNPGEVQRWRFVNSNVRNPLYVQLEGHKLHEIAVDGLALGRIDSWNNVELYPGYRSDVLVKANYPSAGKTSEEFLLYDAGSQITPSGPIASARILAKVVVRGYPNNMALPLSQDLASLVPFEDIMDSEVTGQQDVRFSVDIINGVPIFTINEREFDPSFVRTLNVGDVDQWNLSVSASSDAPVHPFHIHVNPFQMTRMGPDGAMEKVWKDTLAVVQGKNQSVRTRYERYIGKFVIHCHILDHEDRGMMEVIEIVNP